MQIDSSRVVDAMWAVTINARRFGNGEGLMIVTGKDMIAARWLPMEDRRTSMRGLICKGMIICGRSAMRSPPFLHQRKIDVFQVQARWPDRSEGTSNDGSIIIIGSMT